MARVASIDLGTNSLRVLVAELEGPKGLKRLWGDRRIVRLGQGLHGSGNLNESVMNRAVETVQQFVAEAKALGARGILVGATSAVREAANRELLLRRVEQEAGVRPRVLTGLEEALWTLEGIRWLWEQPPPSWLAADVGGGSTELILAGAEGTCSATSVPLGMVRLSEEFLEEDPPGAEAVAACRERAREMIREALGSLGQGAVEPPPVLVGTAGTVTTLAALEVAMRVYDGDAIHGMQLLGSVIKSWSRRLSKMDCRARRALPGMEAGREDVILAGAIIVEELMELVGAEALLVSDHGLLEGMARLVPIYGQPL
ncbi:MAG: Ppx/GppA phosphatase family protein [Thermodesulfobacteriota bacterium]